MNEPKLMGNGEGYTLLILTDAESRLIRECVDSVERGVLHPHASRAFNAGVKRGTERIAAEFAVEQKARKAAG